MIVTPVATSIRLVAGHAHGLPRKVGFHSRRAGLNFTQLPPGLKMPLAICGNCSQQFESEMALQEHILSYQVCTQPRKRGCGLTWSQNRASEILHELHRSRAFELLQELQQCVAHNTLRNPSHEAVARTDSLETHVATKRRIKSKKTETRTFRCPHPDCFRKPKTPFSRRKDLVRHFTTRMVTLNLLSAMT